MLGHFSSCRIRVGKSPGKNPSLALEVVYGFLGKILSGFEVVKHSIQVPDPSFESPTSSAKCYTS